MGSGKLFWRTKTLFVSFEHHGVKVQEVPLAPLSLICACLYIEIAIYFFFVFLFFRKRWRGRVRDGTTASIGVAFDVLMKKRK
jgi:hypothetical protein